MAFCCLGTTRGKAGKQGFVQVDHDYVVRCARLLREAACKDFHLISASGAHSKSYFLTSQTKVHQDTIAGSFKQSNEVSILSTFTLEIGSCTREKPSGEG